MSVESRPFGFDPLTGAYETFHYDHADDTFTIERVENVDALVDHTKALYNENAGSWKGDFHHVASIPNTLLPELERQGIMSSGGRILDRTKFREWLNDRDNRVFRTKPGRV